AAGPPVRARCPGPPGSGRAPGRATGRASGPPPGSGGPWWSPVPGARAAARRRPGDAVHAVHAVHADLGPPAGDGRALDVLVAPDRADAGGERDRVVVAVGALPVEPVEGGGDERAVVAGQPSLLAAMAGQPEDVERRAPQPAHGGERPEGGARRAPGHRQLAADAEATHRRRVEVVAHAVAAGDAQVVRQRVEVEAQVQAGDLVLVLVGQRPEP